MSVHQLPDDKAQSSRMNAVWETSLLFSILSSALVWAVVLVIFRRLAKK